jgi:2-polyprenyl-3-methyl-5-hydroxy-6-metoxy-1,4-benzoquinol methylase
MSPNSLMNYKLAPVVPLDNRVNFIASLCKGRCVMHLGCAAWPLTKQQLEDGSLLHLALSKVSRRVYGIDLDEQGLAFLRERGFKDLIRWDAEKLDELQVEEPADVIVSGEILEHLSNPGLFLQGISRFMKREKSKLVISVPNAFSIRHFVPVMLRQTERVMTDHTAYYSFSTLRELLRRHDLRVTASYIFSNVGQGSSGFKRLLKRTMNATLMHTFPQVSEGLMVVADVNEN